MTTASITTAITNSPSIYEDIAAGRAQVVGLDVDQYRALIESHLLPEDTTTELIEGVMIRKDRSAVGEDPMTVGDRHRICLQRFVRLAPRFDGHGCYLQVQQPITLPPHDEPEPDAAVIRGSENDQTNGPPRPADVICVIEVSDSSLRRDRVVKLRRYALAGVPVYVIVNLVQDLVEVAENPGNGAYQTVVQLRAGDVLRIATSDGSTVDVPVAQLLP